MSRKHADSTLSASFARSQLRPLGAALCAVRLLVIGSALATPLAFGLPEDEQKPLEIEATSSELFLDEGYYVYRGTPEKPAVATKGSMKISGLEIIAEQRDGVFTKVTATGSPARFQQQPEADKPVVFISGKTLVFNNADQFVTADGEAEYIQGGNTIKGDHLEYNIQTRRAAASGTDGRPVNMFIPPAPATETPSTEP